MIPEYAMLVSVIGFRPSANLVPYHFFNHVSCLSRDTIWVSACLWWYYCLFGPLNQNDTDLFFNVSKMYMAQWKYIHDLSPSLFKSTSLVYQPTFPWAWVPKELVSFGSRFSEAIFPIFPIPLLSIRIFIGFISLWAIFTNEGSLVPSLNHSWS